MMRRFISASVAVLLVGAGCSFAGTIGVDLTNSLEATCPATGGATCTPGGTFATGGFQNTTFSTQVAVGPSTFNSSQQSMTWGSNTVNMVFNKKGLSNNTYLINSASNGVGGAITYDLNTYNSNSPTMGSGVFGVNTLWTMINSVAPSAGTVVITLNGTTGANGGGSAISDTITLTSGFEYRDTVYAVGNNTTDNATPSCGSAAACAAQTNSSVGALHVSNTYGDQVAVFNGVNGYTNTGTGKWLDGQQLVLGATNPFLTGYLNAVTIDDVALATSPQSLLISGLAYTAPTSTPEPATMGILGIGLALIGSLRIRKKKSSD